MRKTPTSVMVLSIIGIIMGVLGILGVIFTAVTLLVEIGPPNPALDPLRHDPLYLTVSTVGLLIGFAAGILLVTSSIGSIKLQPWARKGMVIYAWVAIIQVVIGLIFNVAYVFPKMYAGVSTANPALRAGMIGGIVGGTCGIVLGLIFPLCILYFFNRTHVKNAFQGIFPDDPTNFPVQFPEAPPPPQNLADSTGPFR